MHKTLIAAAILSCFAVHSEAVEIIGKPGEQEISFKVLANNKPANNRLLVENKNNGFWVKTSDLEQFDLEIDDLSTEVELDQICDKALLNYKKLTSELQFKTKYLKVQTTNFRPSRKGTLLDNKFGGWVNYSGYVTSYGIETGFQAQLGLNLSTKWGTLTSQHVFNSLNKEEPWKRVATTLTRFDPDNLSTTEIGDTYSSPGYWGSNVRIMGLRMASDYTLDPSFNRLPTYVFTGTASAPSTIEMFENGRKVYSGHVDSRPFSLSGYQPINGNGEVQVIVRDAMGNEQIIRQAIYSSPLQLAHGVDYKSVEMGLLNNGITYQEPFFGALYRRGFDMSMVSAGWLISKVIPRATFEGRMEGTAKDMRIGIGAALSTDIGNISLSGAIGQRQSSSGAQGGASMPSNGSDAEMLAAQDQYDKETAQAGKRPMLLSASWDRSFDFGTFGNVYAYANARLPENWTPIGGTGRQSKVVFGGLTYSPMAGLSANYLGSQITEPGSKTPAVSHTIGLTKELSNVGSVSLSMSKSEVSTTAMLSLTVPLGSNRVSSASLSKDNSYLSYSDTSIADTRLNVGLGKSKADTRFDGNISRDFEKGRAEASVSSAAGMTGYRVGGSGSLIVADGDYFFAKNVSNTVVIVDAGVPDVGIKTNGRISTTGSSGKVAIPDLSAWNETKFEFGEGAHGDYQIGKLSKAIASPRGKGIGKVQLVLDEPKRTIGLSFNGDLAEDSFPMRINGKSVRHVGGDGIQTNILKADEENLFEVAGCRQSVLVTKDQEVVDLNCDI